MPSFGKILGAVSEINCVTDGRTDARTDKGDIIEPVASLVQKAEKYFFFSLSRTDGDASYIDASVL